MKRLAVVLLCGVIGIQIANCEYKNNPDRFTSVGINYTGYNQDGDSTIKASGFSASQEMKSRQDSLSVDARVPVSDNMTLNLGLGTANGKTTASETGLLAGGNSDLKGYALNFGLRLYLNNSGYNKGTEERVSQYNQYVISMERLNTEREQANLLEKKIMDYYEWKNKTGGYESTDPEKLKKGPWEE